MLTQDKVLILNCQCLDVKSKIELYFDIFDTGSIGTTEQVSKLLYFQLMTAKL